ncbi:MAG: prepilin-type processing-associated H-X9-DG protein [Rhodothermales bacterium]|jgi:prepilin-type processing-associated H-X9-DG protein
MPSSISVRKHRATRVLSFRTFSLVELLTVIAVIAILMSMLMPSLSRSRESAKRAACASNHRQIGLAAFEYARNNKMWLPPSQPTLKPGWGVEAIWQASRGLGFGHGLLIEHEYLSEADAALFYCPSWRHPYLRHGGISNDASLDTQPPGTQGGWPKPDQVVKPRGWYVSSLIYRGSFGGSRNRPARLTRDRGQPYLADSWIKKASDRKITPYGQGYFGHQQGYNSLWLDGHVAWIDDTPRTVMATAPLNAKYGLIEAGWAKHFEN